LKSVHPNKFLLGSRSTSAEVHKQIMIKMRRSELITVLVESISRVAWVGGFVFLSNKALNLQSEGRLFSAAYSPAPKPPLTSTKSGNARND